MSPTEELARQQFAAFHDRDLDRFLAGLDPNVEVVPIVGSELADTVYHGHRGVRDWWEHIFSVFPNGEVALEDVRDLGDRVIVASRFHAQGIASDRPDLTVWTLSDVRDGKIVTWRTFRTEAEALEAASAEQDS
jgi:ketosteroid isomerase-like protein